jgi:hypothetical protein
MRCIYDDKTEVSRLLFYKTSKMGIVEEKLDRN